MAEGSVLLAVVALRKESVDRNVCVAVVIVMVSVALRKESVDRNPTIKAMRGDRKASLSARRAWIEITSGSVAVPVQLGRSPQGERG